MRVLIGYDGSVPSQAALHDLERAGLPPDTEAWVIACTDPWPHVLPPQTTLYETGDEYAGGPNEPVEHLKMQLAAAAEWLRGAFPTWRVRGSVRVDSPLIGLVTLAKEWNAQLLVAGSRGLSTMARLLMGSISEGLLWSAPCSVRIGRASERQGSAPVRILIGYDGSDGAESAVRAVAQRVWPSGSETTVVSVVDPEAHKAITSGSVADANGMPGLAHWLESAEAAAEMLRTAGLRAQAIVHGGAPKSALLEQAAEYAADCIFLGSHGRSRLGRLLLGSVATAITVRATCSVEVVRSQPPVAHIS
jgi:nucleotide-binding universal stress UspA family protein